MTLLQAGAVWMARSARTALTALQRSGIVLRRQWTSPRLQPWEGAFADPDERLPQAPEVATERKAARKAMARTQRTARMTAAVAAEAA